ncbi:MAG: alpha/beta hydrolase family protein [Thermotogota bacterium]
MKKMLIIAFLLIPIMFFANEEFLIGDPLPDAPELAYRGEYAVGVRTLNIVDKDRLDILNFSENNTNPIYDRPLTVEVWYPGEIDEGRIEKTVYVDEQFVDDAIVFTGRALRNAKPVEGKFPLVIVSHGYPGTRFMMSYLTENLASKGYVVAAISHTESTVRDQNRFSSTLLNRPLDILFTLDEIERFSKQKDSFLFELVDTDNVGLAGYSMGGYGIINVAGAGFSESGVNLSWGVPGGHLSIRQSGNPEYERTIDERIKAIFAMAPWGADLFWDEESMEGLEVPSFFVTGNYDDVAGYENGVKLFYDRAVHSQRHMLVFQNARHNVAPNAYGVNPLVSVKLDDEGFIRYNEPSWDNRKLNNTVQHFATAFFGQYLKGQNFGSYMDLIELSNEGVWSQNEDGTFREDHTHWKGFPARTALGMEFYSSKPE